MWLWLILLVACLLIALSMFCFAAGRVRLAESIVDIAEACAVVGAVFCLCGF